MSENLNGTPEAFSEEDFDAWLAGGERTSHYVALYGRFDIIADIEELEKQRVPYTPPAEEDRAVGGDFDPNAEIEAKIDALNAQIHASKREFRVTVINDDELELIKSQIREEMSDEISVAAAKGRSEAKKTAARFGVVTATEINQIVAVGAKEETDKLIGNELLIRKIAASATTRYKGEWRPLTKEGVVALRKNLGDVQIQLLSDAAWTAANEVPTVNVPK